MFEFKLGVSFLFARFFRGIFVVKVYVIVDNLRAILGASSTLRLGPGFHQSAVFFRLEECHRVLTEAHAIEVKNLKLR